MPFFTDYKTEPCARCFCTDWQVKTLRRIEDMEMEFFLQTCRVCGFSEEWWKFYEEGE